MPSTSGISEVQQLNEDLQGTKGFVSGFRLDLSVRPSVAKCGCLWRCGVTLPNGGGSNLEKCDEWAGRNPWDFS